MIINEELTVQEFLSQLESGRKQFTHVEVDEWTENRCAGGLLTNGTYNDISFEECLITADFSNSIMRRCKFINCDIKTCVFDNVDLTGTEFCGNAVESISMKNAVIENVLFIGNSAYGATLSQSDLPKLIKE